MGQIEELAVNLTRERGTVERDATLLLQVVATPDVMVAREKMHLHPAVGQLGELAQKAGISFGHDSLELIPEVKHVAQQIDRCGVVLNLVQEVHQPALLRAAVRDGTRTEVRIRKEIDILHT